MDEGWTRLLLERTSFRYVNLSNEDIKDGSFADESTSCCFPTSTIDHRSRRARPLRAATRSVDARCRRTTPVASEPDGGEQIMEWVEEGGTVVALDSSTDYLIDLFDLPVHNVLAEDERDEFSCPGTMLRILVDTSHPLGFGMRSEEAAYFASSPAFRPAFRTPASTAASSPATPTIGTTFRSPATSAERRISSGRRPLSSSRSARGRVVLIGFRAQHRAQPLAPSSCCSTRSTSAGLEKAHL